MEVAFKMVKSSPTERASPEEIINDLHNMLQPLSQIPSSEKK